MTCIPPHARPLKAPLTRALVFVVFPRFERKNEGRTFAAQI